MAQQLSPDFSVSTAGYVRLIGAWTASGLEEQSPVLDLENFSPDTVVRFDFSQISTLDTFGAAALTQTFDSVRENGLTIEISGATDRQRLMIAALDKSASPSASTQDHDLITPLASVGKTVVEAGSDAADMVNVLGHVVWSVFSILTLRSRVRLAAIANQFQDIVLKAIPIVALISLVVGIILTQQSIAQLRNFGATIFVVDLGGILMLREIGILLAAIMVAGRSGSAITAEIGAMKMREEIDALEVMGLDTYRSVAMPRVLALLAGMPALGLIGAIAGIVGAALVARISGGISLENFIARLANVVDVHIILVGMIKAPFMALAISVIAIAEGLQVSGSTQSLGRHTTASVVKSIFIVIVIDGLFAIFFEAIGF